MVGFDGTPRAETPITSGTSGTRTVANAAHDLKNRKDNLLRGGFSEFIAMMLFVYFGCGSASSNVRKFANGEWDPASVLIISMQFGLGITVLAYTIAHASGGHINCAVTWCLTLTGQCHPLRGMFYLVSQLLGSIAGALLLDLTTNIDTAAIIAGGDATAFAGLKPECGIDRSCGLGANGLQNPWVGTGHAFAAEVMSTMLLCIVVLETACNPDSIAKNLAPIPIGLAVFMAHVFCIPITGCSINPTRSFGPSLIANSWDNHWIWWLGPMTGATLASFIWYIMHLPALRPLSKAEMISNGWKDTLKA